MTFTKQAKATILKKLDGLGDDVAESVRDHISKNLGIDEPTDNWIKNNVDRLRVKKDGTKTEINNRSFLNMFSKLNPNRTAYKIDADLDTGRIRADKQSGRIFTSVEKGPDKAPTGGSWRGTAAKIVGGAGLGAGATGMGMAMGSKKDSSSKNKNLKKQYLNYVRQKRQGV